MVEEPDDVELGHKAVAPGDRFAHPPHRLLGAASRPIAEAARQETALEHWFDHLASGLLDHPIGDGGYPEGAGASIGLGDVDPPHGRGHIALRREQPTTQ